MWGSVPGCNIWSVSDRNAWNFKLNYPSPTQPRALLRCHKRDHPSSAPNLTFLAQCELRTPSTHSPNSNFFFKLLNGIQKEMTFSYWSIVDLQCCANFCRKEKWLSYTHIYFLFYIIFKYNLSQETGCLPCMVGPCFSIFSVIVCIY